MTSDFEFSYPNEKITHLTESSESNSALSTAFSNLGSNYTITSYSDSSDVMIKTYVTDDGIYQHYTGNQENLSVNDILIKVDLNTLIVLEQVESLNLFFLI